MNSDGHGLSRYGYGNAHKKKDQLYKNIKILKSAINSLEVTEGRYSTLRDARGTAFERTVTRRGRDGHKNVILFLFFFIFET
jgi:hypothetical protein